MTKRPANWVRRRMFPNYLGWRPYFACGRRQLRIGIKKYVPLTQATSAHAYLVRPYVRFIALEWQ